MDSIVTNLNKLGLIAKPNSGRSIEILENINKLNIIHNEDISENYATELFLSMCLREDKDVVAFAKAYGVDGELTVEDFFREFRKVRMQKDKQIADYNNLEFDVKYYDLINNILKTGGDLVKSIKSYVQIPTIQDYLTAAKQENDRAKEKNPNLDSEIENEENITGNCKNAEYKKFNIDNYKEQILKVSKGFNVRMVMITSKNLNDSQLKLMSKFKNIKTSSMAKIINKKGGQGYLSSPTKERRVTYYPMDKRFFGPVSQEKPKDLSYNEMLFYSIYDLNGRALKYKKSYIANAITKYTGKEATKEDVKFISDITRNLASRYMLFGIDLNNETGFDPNVVFDYRLEALFMNRLRKVENKEIGRCVLPIAQELAGNMAIEFFQNAGIEKSTVKQNLMKASQYLPEFRRTFDGGSYAGILFNSDASTYNAGRSMSKVKPLKKVSVLSKVKDKIGNLVGTQKNNKTQTSANNVVNNNVEKEKVAKIDIHQPKKEVEIKDKKVIQNAKEINYKLFGQEKVFKLFTFDEYCDHFVENVLKPCSEDKNLPKAKAMLDKYNAITDEKLTSKEKLISVVGEENLDSFYYQYASYTRKEATRRCKNCEDLAKEVKDAMLSKITNKINMTASVMTENGQIVEKDRYDNLTKLLNDVIEDNSLSNIDETEKLVKIVVNATKEKSEKETVSDADLLNDVSKKESGKDLDGYIDDLIENYLEANKVVTQENDLSNKEVVKERQDNKNNIQTQNGLREKVGSERVVLNGNNDFYGKCQKEFTARLSILIDNEVSRLSNLMSIETGDKKDALAKDVAGYQSVNDVLMSEQTEWVKRPEYQQLNDRLESCISGMHENENIINFYMTDYFDVNQKAIAKEVQDIYNNVQTQNASVNNEQTQNASENNAEKENNEVKEKTSFEIKIEKIINDEVKKNNDRVIANNIATGYNFVKVRDFDDGFQDVVVKSIPKTAENAKEFAQLSEFYKDLGKVDKNIVNKKIEENVTLSEAETAYSQIVNEKNKYVDCYNSSNQTANENDYLFGITNGLVYGINKILENAENNYLAKNLNLVSEKSTKLVERNEKEVVNNAQIQNVSVNNEQEKSERRNEGSKKKEKNKLTLIEGANQTASENDYLVKNLNLVSEKSTKLVERNEKEVVNNAQTQNASVNNEHAESEGNLNKDAKQKAKNELPSIEKANKVKAINREIRKEVMTVLAEKSNAVYENMKNSNLTRESKAYKFYDLYAKTFASVKRVYDPNSTNTPYKGISEETVVGIKSKIDKYIKKEIVSKISADADFSNLSVEELVQKYLNKDHLKYLVTEIVERNNSALIADNYNIDIFGRDVKTQKNKLMGLEEFKQSQGEKDLVDDAEKVAEEKIEQVEEEPEVVEEININNEEPEVIEETEEKKIERENMKNLSIKGNKIKECKVILREDVKDILNEKVETVRDDMTRMNSKNNAYKFYDLYAKSFNSIRKFYDSSASNTVYNGISEECALGVKKSIDEYIEKQIIANIKTDSDFDNLDASALIEKYRDNEQLKSFVINCIENNINNLISNNYLLNINSANKKSKVAKDDEPEYVNEEKETERNQ